ncbi:MULTISPECIES: EAL domain-containing protein [unclassified Halomonas]|uniref:EAL domain-containing protein n=1 Tax=unclassified Halomonas TaxID=2609666 RepID=UPI00403365DF
MTGYSEPPCGYQFLLIDRWFGLPVDNIKLDRAFIRELPNSKADVAIVKAVLAMAEGMGLDVVAEGVETLEQRWEPPLLAAAAV